MNYSLHTSIIHCVSNSAYRSIKTSVLLYRFRNGLTYCHTSANANKQ